MYIRLLIVVKAEYQNDKSRKLNKTGRERTEQTEADQSNKITLSTHAVFKNNDAIIYHFLSYLINKQRVAN